MVDQQEIEHLMYAYFKDPWSEQPITPDDYVIDTQGAVHVNSDVYMTQPPANRMIPVQFGVVDGAFDISDRNLTTLQGAPHTVISDFDCSMNALTSLVHAPKKLGPLASFRCDGNQLTSLAHCPPVTGELVCNHNQLTNLIDAPACAYLFAPKNPFTSFQNTPAHIQQVLISYSQDLPLLGLLTVGKIWVVSEMWYPGNDENHMLDLEQILNRHTQQGRAAMLKCAGELIRAGYKGNARW